MATQEPDRITIPLRLSRDLHAQLKDLAAKDERSLNAFIAFALSRLVTGVRNSNAATVALNPYLSGAKTRKARPNDPCPCGSGTKYKKCHGRA
jgi:uncharacterized protein YchJ